MIAIRPVGLRQNRFATPDERRMRVYERIESDEGHSASRQIAGICIGAILLVVVYASRSLLGF